MCEGFYDIYESRLYEFIEVLRVEIMYLIL